MAYSEKVMDHFMNPRNVGVMPDADGVGEVGNAKCGDIMKIFIKVKDNIITDISFQTFGCGAAIATSSMATELAKGKSVEEALELTNLAVAEALDGLPPIKMHCSNLAADGLRAAIYDYKVKNGMSTEGFEGGRRLLPRLRSLTAVLLLRFFISNPSFYSH